MKIIQLPVDKLSKDPANARKHSQKNIDAIIASLRRFGQQKPIVVDKSNVVRAGNGTLEAARQLGWETIAAVQSELVGADMSAYAIADNRTSELAEWDDEVLKATLEGFDDALREAAGFDLDEVEKLLQEQREVTEDEVPEPPANPITQPGDLWILGNHRLLCGDSTKAEDVERLMNGTKADMCFTSPPYNAGVVITDGKHSKKYQDIEDKQDADGYLEFLQQFFDCAFSVSEYVFVNIQMLSGNKESMVRFLHANLNRYADCIVWDKLTAEPAMPRKVTNSRFEFIHVFSKKANRSIGVRDFRGDVDNVLSLNSRQDKEHSKIHKATFPVAFPCWFLSNFSVDASVVYEPFCGTGTTLIAAEQLDRKCYGMEISPAYCDVIVKRWETLTGKQAYRDNE